jgi:hypothetical protein
MPEPRERIARALSCLQGHPPDIRFEGSQCGSLSCRKQTLHSGLPTSTP